MDELYMDHLCGYDYFVLLYTASHGLEKVEGGEGKRFLCHPRDQEECNTS